ncbi:hypothetical protein ACIRTB_21250 [Streptomyces sp. NPDC101158]|uniref:hypothetical protein n=1 Tax=Streptomyces sp. NPDC101158 TaxID=3366117 RepID=UPI0038051F40
MSTLPAPRRPGRTWTVRLTGHPDHTAAVTCTSEACRMPPRSKDLTVLRRFADQHARAHARVTGPRPDAACACGAAGCRHHSARATCSGRNLLVLIHNRAVAEVWTVVEICQTCAPLVAHATVLAGAREAQAPVRTAAVVRTPAAPRAVPMGFAAPEPAGGQEPLPPPRRRPHLRGPRDDRRAALRSPR